MEKEKVELENNPVDSMVNNGDEPEEICILSDSLERVVHARFIENGWLQISATRRTKHGKTPMQTNFVNISPEEVDALYEFLTIDEEGDEP